MNAQDPKLLTARTVKVAVYIVVEVDIDALEAEYGQKYSRAEAIADARSSMITAATQAAYPAASNDSILRVIRTN